VDVGAIDLEIVDYWRVSPTPSDPIEPNWFRIQMSTRAIIRETVLRFVNEAVQTVHDNQLRAIARDIVDIGGDFSFLGGGGRIPDSSRSRKSGSSPSPGP
jgi:hypothetical protein